MRGYQFTPQASDDLFEISRYIAHDSVPAAERVEYAVHLIVYDPATKPLQIIRVLHGARNLPRLVDPAPVTG